MYNSVFNLIIWTKINLFLIRILLTNLFNDRNGKGNVKLFLLLLFFCYCFFF
ncbi:hypothetical protein C2G38_2098567 [Gigaspora rosea]|uniref:Uncharacterized protein n=1 Tax=Gigaspora rosea TaxID=44941 RepID=A0A397USZ7_9GLOM|nr:hypothetical protein C2G38_2098567 [Gigaspora rosea]